MSLLVQLHLLPPIKPKKLSPVFLPFSKKFIRYSNCLFTMALPSTRLYPFFVSLQHIQETCHNLAFCFQAFGILIYSMYLSFSAPESFTTSVIIPFTFLWRLFPSLHVKTKERHFYHLRKFAAILMIIKKDLMFVQLQRHQAILTVSPLKLF